MADTFRDNVKVTVSGTPGTGAVTWLAAVTDSTNGDYLNPDSSGAVTGESHSLFLQDGASTSIETGCVYTTSTKTWARGTVLVSSTGSQLSLTSAAKVSIVAASADITNTASMDALLFGDGSDGDVTVSGAVTLGRDMYYRNLTLAAGAAVNPNGWRVFVSQDFDISSAPAGAIGSVGNSGGNASTFTAGTVTGFSRPSGMLTPAPTGAAGTGATGTTSAGASGSGSSTINPVAGGSASVSSGAGGAGSNAAGAAATSTSTAVMTPRLAASLISHSSQVINVAVPGPGGGGGGGDGTNKGGGGGAGGANPFAIEIFARTIKRGASTAAAAIKSIGGDGGNGGTVSTGNVGGGGGGGGSDGGFVALTYRYLTGAAAANCIDISGGKGGNGGNGAGTGTGGDGGSSGAPGALFIADIGKGAVTVSTSSTQNAGSAHTGTTGGAGGAQVVAQYSL